MSVLCRIVGHHIVSPAPPNQRLEFGRCCRCHRDMMRSVRDAPGSWIEVPSRSRVRWGEFDPDQPAPRYLRAAYDRVRATGRWYASASRAAMYTSRAVVGEGGDAIATRMHGWIAPARSSDASGRRVRSLPIGPRDGNLGFMKSSASVGRSGFSSGHGAKEIPGS